MADAADLKAPRPTEQLAVSRNHSEKSIEIDPQIDGRCELGVNNDAVESALANALKAATDAQQWEVVTQIAGELQARRIAKSTNVVTLNSATRKASKSRE